MSDREPGGFDGQQSIYRGNLYVHIDQQGEVDFHIVRAERPDAPAMLMACLVMTLQLAQMIAEDWHP